MAHALVTTVNLEGRSREEAEQTLNDQVIPAVKQVPGFQRGTWLRSADGKTGMGVVVFESEDAATAAREAMPAMRPADAPPIVSSEIYDVTGLA
jgi:hypothetical protein